MLGISSAVMKLHPMTDSEYEFWSARSQANYATDKMKANSLTRADAEAIAAADFKRNLPDGLLSKNSFLYTAKDAEGNRLGFIWFTIRGGSGNQYAYICDVIIEEPHRGRGLGKQLMRLIEDKVKEQGLSRIGLHVFGFNEPAIRVYQSLGYLTTDLVMEKRL